MLHNLASIRELPAGSTVLKRRDLGIGTFERISAGAGTFAANYGEYAIILAQGPIYGHVTLNEVCTRTRSNSRFLYSVLRPGDCVTGVLEKPAAYEILLLSSQYVNEFLADEDSLSEFLLTSKLRADAPRFMQSIWRCMSSFIDTRRADVEPLIMLCIELLLVNLSNGPAGSPSLANARQRREALARAAQFIENHFGDPIDVELIARVAGLSPSHFNRVFKTRHHVSVHRFVVLRRLERVRQLLSETDQPIAAVALEVGFSSQSHLTTAFRQRYAMTPAQYRADTRRLRRR